MLGPVAVPPVGRSDGLVCEVEVPEVVLLPVVPPGRSDGVDADADVASD